MIYDQKHVWNEFLKTFNARHDPGHTVPCFLPLAGCPGAADGDGWVLVQARGGRASGSARMEVRVAMAAWLTAGAPSVGASLHVTAVGQPRKDGTCRAKVKLSLGVMRGPAEVKTQVRVAGARAQQGTGVRLRLSSAQIRREGGGVRGPSERGAGSSGESGGGPHVCTGTAGGDGGGAPAA